MSRFVLIFAAALIATSGLAVDRNELFVQGAMAFQKQDYETAIARFTEVIAIEPANPDPYRNRAQAYLARREFDKAIADCDQAIRLSPGEPHDHAVRGSAYAEKGKADKAMADLKEAIRLKSKDASPRYGLGLIYLARKEFKEAVRYFSDAIKIDPKNAPAYQQRGLAQAQLGRLDEAIADCTEAIRYAPGLAAAYEARADSYFQKNEAAKSISDYTRALELGIANAPVVRANRGLAYGRLGDFEAGIADCTEAFRMNPQSPHVNNNLAWLLAVCPDPKLRDGRKARAHALEACKATGWKRPYELGTFAAACAELGDFDEAVKRQKESLALGLPKEDEKAARERLKLYEQKKPYHQPARSPALP